MSGLTTYKLDHDWSKLYGRDNFDGELVLDVGADLGSTARFFLAHGARAVVCSEPSSSVYFRRLEALAALDRRIVVTDAVLSENEARALLDAWRPDTLALDCEGCERYFLVAILETLPPCILGEVHGDGAWAIWQERLSERYRVEMREVNRGQTGGATFRAERTP